ncbi:hypothetical protein PRIC1_006051 [Phytophthora ramorum]
MGNAGTAGLTTAASTRSVTSMTDAPPVTTTVTSTTVGSMLATTNTTDTFPVTITTEQRWWGVDMVRHDHDGSVSHDNSEDDVAKYGNDRTGVTHASSNGRVTRHDNDDYECRTNSDAGDNG